jgi:LPXTG-motif cell wall-anchored protein
MSGIKIIAIFLIVIGVLALVYGGFTYTSKINRASIGPIDLAIKEKSTVNIPIWAGVVSIAAGAGLFLVGRKKR